MILKAILPFFSYLFHPLFIPLYAVLCFFTIDDNYLVPAEKILIVIQVVIIMVLIPIAFFFMLRTFGKVDTVMVSDVRQRKLPLLLQSVLIFLLIWQGISPDRVPELYYFFIGALAISILSLGFAYAKVKVSLHMAALAAMLLFVVGLSIHNHYNAIGTIASLLAFTGLVASSRLEMDAHDTDELVLGFFTGAVPQMAMWYFWL